MPKVLSLSKNEDFKTVLGGKKILNKFVTIYYKKLTINDKNKFIYSIIAKKKLGNAVFRNKIKRRLRSIALEAYKKININLKYSYIFIAKNCPKIAIYLKIVSVFLSKLRFSFTLNRVVKSIVRLNV